MAAVNAGGKEAVSKKKRGPTGPRTQIS